MNKQFYFIAGFPRSGSTLLTGILKQNPLFHSEINDSLFTMFRSAQFNESKNIDILAATTDQTKNIFHSVLSGYYKEVEKPIIFNTNRYWGVYDSLLTRLLPYTKIIACVRDIPSILNSFEYYYKFKSLQAPTFVSYDGVMNPYHRIEEYFESTIKNLYEIYNYSSESPILKENYIFIDYDDLVSHPKQTLNNLYSTLDLTCFEHNFDNVVLNYDDLDNTLGNFKLHSIKGKVKKQDTKWVLPYSLIEKYNLPCFWRTK